MQLVAYGAQDIYLTGNPQITFFKVVYRRHTNFSMETIQQTINGTSTIGSTASTGTVTISRNGDLVYKTYVRCDYDESNGISGDNLIQQVECEIGGQLIDRQYKEWLQVWAELTTPASKWEGYAYMTGGFKDALVHSDGTYGSLQQSIQIPLQFWFNRNPGLALPLIALQYHEVKLKFTWGTSATDGSGVGADNTAATPTVEVWCDYIYLDTDERRRFAQVSHEYLIEQIQKQNESGATVSSTKLNFNHPIKELIWTAHPDKITTQKTKLVLNGHDRFAQQDKDYFTLRQPYDYHTSVPGYNVKFSRTVIPVKPIMIAWEDAMTADGTAVDTLHTVVSATAGTTTGFDLKIGTNFIPAATSSNFPKVGDILRFEIRDESEIATGARHRSVHAQVKTVASQTNGWVISCSVEDDADSVATAWIVGTTADDNVCIQILGRHQYALSHCSQLARDIYVYSFALKPEEHQPSGTCNFSRIDNAQLQWSDAVADVTDAGIEGTDVTDEDDINIYAVNYNVLRIMSGMGGLAYSN